MKVAVIGAGSWGTAIAGVAAVRADDVVLWIETDMDWEDIGAALRSRVRRSESIRSVTLIREGKDIRLSRADILQEGFKIRPADLT